LLLQSAACVVFFFQAVDGIRDRNVTGVQTCALPIWAPTPWPSVPQHLLHWATTTHAGLKNTRKSVPLPATTMTSRLAKTLQVLRPRIQNLPHVSTLLRPASAWPITSRSDHWKNRPFHVPAVSRASPTWHRKTSPRPPCILN